MEPNIMLKNMPARLRLFRINYTFFLIWANSVIFRGVWRGVGTNRVLLWKLTESRVN